MENSTAAGGIQFKERQIKSRGIKVTSKLGFSGHPMLDHFKFVNEMAGDHMAKMAIPSPSMLHFRGEIDDSVYPNEESFFTDLAATYKQAIQSFYNKGCRYLQLDDTAWAYFCSEEQLEHLRD